MWLKPSSNILDVTSELGRKILEFLYMHAIDNTFLFVGWILQELN
jgi:hypothetical protein